MHWFSYTGFSWFGDRKHKGGGVDQTQFSQQLEEERLFSTELCRARYLVGAKAEQLESMCDVVLGICHTFCMIKAVLLW